MALSIYIVSSAYVSSTGSKVKGEIKLREYSSIGRRAMCTIKISSVCISFTKRKLKRLSLCVKRQNSDVVYNKSIKSRFVILQVTTLYLCFLKILLHILDDCKYNSMYPP